MKILFLIFITISFLNGQDVKSLFDAGSTYLDRGEFQLSIIKATDNSIDQSFTRYYPIEWRTIAVDPTKILPGSIVFIPGLAGTKMPDNTYHDGYFLAHKVIKNYPSDELKLLLNAAHSSMQFEKIQKVYKVQGAMEKSVRARFEWQYKQKELPTYRMVWTDFNNLMKEGNQKYSDINDRIQFYSEKGIGTPYLVFNLGEGASSLIDPDPTIDFSRTDCMTFCEHTLALAISSNYSEMYENLQKIRYKMGEVEFTKRNHYTIADWLPNNSWLLEDVTKMVGKGVTKTITKNIDRPAFYKNNGVRKADLENGPGAVSLTVDYVPKEKVMQAAHNLKGGEIVSIVTTHPAVISAHMGIIVIEDWGNIIFRHASSTEQTSEVMDERLSDYIRKMIPSKSRIGMIFIRARQEFKIPQ
jgi:3D (Asp-Asp-Asp) domain-containing protein